MLTTVCLSPIYVISEDLIPDFFCRFTLLYKIHMICIFFSFFFLFFFSFVHKDLGGILTVIHLI